MLFADYGPDLLLSPQINFLVACDSGNIRRIKGEISRFVYLRFGSVLLVFWRFFRGLTLVLVWPVRGRVRLCFSPSV